MNRRASLLFVLAGLAVFGPQPAMAGFPPDVPDTYQLAIGGTLATIGSGAALGLSSGGAKAMLSFEDFFNLDYSGIRGSMTQSTLRYNWYFARNAGLGLGYDQISINLAKYRTDDNTARFNYSIQGLSLYLRSAY